MWKWILGIFVALVVMLIVVVLFFLGPIVKPPATSVASSVMGVDVTMDSLSVSPLKGSVGLGGLNIANPPGYNSSHFVNLENMKAGARIISFMGDTVSMNEIIIDGLSVNIESKGGKTNMSTILDNIEKSSGTPSKPDEPASSTSEGKKFRIDLIQLKNVRVSISTGFIKDIKLSLGDFEVRNVGTDDTGASLSTVLKKIIAALASKVSEGSKTLGADLQKALKDGGITDGLSDITSKLGKTGEKALEKIKDPLKNIFK